jgi:alpha-glucosidase (family GH31 glycosyl hydrolase)
MTIGTEAFLLRRVKSPPALEFCDRAGSPKLRLALSAIKLRRKYRLHFQVVGEQHFYGLGQGGQPFDRLGVTRRLWNRHVNHGPGGDIAVPLILSNAGYGLFFDHPGPASFDAGSSNDITYLDYECEARALDFYYLAGASLRETLGLIATLLGSAAMPPRWALGYLQSTRHFENHSEIMRLADTFRDKSFPCDAIIFLSSYGDARGWNLGVGSLDYEPALIGDGRAFVEALHERGFRVVMHEYPVLHGESPLYEQASTDGRLLEEGYQTRGDAEPSATDYHQGQRYINFFRQEVGGWWWQKHRALVDDGVDGWWLDGGEGPDSDLNEPQETNHNRYDLLRQQAFFEGEARDRPEKRAFLLCRSGGPGMQRFGACCWSGDINNTWTTLEEQLSVGLNVGLSGIPYWGTDIGGFYAVAPETHELFLRWFQFGAFCPIFRAHGQNWRMHLPWAYGAEVEEICRRYVELRYRLLPYTYTLAWQAHQQGLPPMRPLVLNYPDDPQVWQLASEFLWGDDILVAPVTRGGVTHWPVYLPKGVWHDFWTHQAFRGPLWVSAPAPLDRLPLFVRSGAILPFGPVTQHWDGQRPAEMTILVYPERRSSFTLYEDDDETNSYRTGGFVVAGFECEASPESTRIRFGASQGETRLCAAKRSFNLRVRSAVAPQSVKVVGPDDATHQPSWGFDGCFFNCVIQDAPAQITLRY